MVTSIRCSNHNRIAAQLDVWVSGRSKSRSRSLKPESLRNEVERRDVVTRPVVQRSAEVAVEEEGVGAIDPAHRFDPVAGVDSCIVHDPEDAAARGLRETDVVGIEPPKRAGREALRGRTEMKGPVC